MAETRTISGIVMLSLVSALVYRAPPRKLQPPEKAPLPTIAQQAPPPSDPALYQFNGGENLLKLACGDDWAKAMSVGSCASGLQTLIVSVPDPYDSHVDWAYDADLEAVRRGVEATGYVIDRFELPGSDSIAIAKSLPFVHAHQKAPRRAVQPGVILFRPTNTAAVNAPRDTGSARRRLLLVYVIGEVPTYGIHKEALRQAMSERKRLLAQAKDSEPEIRMIMPVFSGSVPSLAVALHDEKEPIFMLSGSASDPMNQKLLERAEPRIKYFTTINNDASLDSVRDSYVLKRLLADSDAIAVLHESSTTYGAQDIAETRSTDGRRVLRIPFPLNIAEFRAKYQQPALHSTDEKLPGSSAHNDRVDIDLRVQRRAPITPGVISDLTPAAVDLVMKEIVGTLRRNRVRAVVLHATDVRDKLFLAQLIRDELKDVQLITYESNILFLRNEFSHALRGMIVLSSYPLIMENQDWTNGKRDERIVFPSDAAQGIYNAVVVSLGHNRLSLEYGTPFMHDSASNNGPPVWITAVGAHSVLPVGVGVKSSALGIKLPSDSTSYDPHEVSFAWVIILLGIISASIYAAVSTVLDRKARGNQREWREGIQRQEVPPFYPDLFGFLSFVSTLVLIAPLAAVILGYSNTRLHTALVVSLWIAGIVWVVTSSKALLPIFVGGGPFRKMGQTFAYVVTRKRYPWPQLVVEIMARAFLVLAGIMLIWLTVSYFFEIRRLSHTTFELFAFRALQIDSGVTPLVPMMLMAAGLLAWCTWHRGRVRELREGTAFEEMVLQLGVPTREEDRAHGINELRAQIPILRERLVFIFPVRSSSLLAVILLIITAWILHYSRGTVERLAYANPRVFYGRSAFDAILQAAVISMLAVGSWAVMRLLLVWKSLQRILIATGETPLAWSLTSLPAAIRRSIKPSLINVSNRQPLGPAANAQWRHQHDIPVEGPAPKGAPPQTPESWWFPQQTAANMAVDLGRVQETLTAIWDAEPLQIPWNPKDSSAYTKGWAETPTSEWRKRAESFVAGQLVYYIEWAQGQLRRMSYFLLISLIISIGLVSSYPFQPQSVVKSLLALLVAGAMGSILYVTGQMNRDPVLSALSGGDPGVLSWNKDMWLNIVVYAGVPVLTLLSSEVPIVRDVVFSWAGPLIKSLAKF